MTRTTLAAIVAAGLLASSGAAHAAPPSDMQTLHGRCDPQYSFTAEGPIGSDLTKRESRFYCDAAVITFFDNGRLMIQFSEREAHHGPILGFAGTIGAQDGGHVMFPDHVYLAPGAPTPVRDGWCTSFFKGKHLSAIFCWTKIYEGGRRTMASASFSVSPNQ